MPSLKDYRQKVSKNHGMKLNSTKQQGQRLQEGKEISMSTDGMKYTTNLTFESSGSQLASKGKQLKELLNDESTDQEILELLG